MRVFAKNPVFAKSRFWYFMKRQHKVRRIDGEVVSVNEVSKITLIAFRSLKRALIQSRTTELF
jgi:hypothetical protein